MIIKTNERLIQRNARIGQITMLVGLVILLGGMFISFRMPERFDISLLALLLGFILSQVGIYFSNRWGRHPRPYNLINQALKGLNRSYSLYHYETPASHLLVGPAGVWVLMPRHQGGTITYDVKRGRWKQVGGNWYLKIFAQESLGRPDLEVEAEKEKVANYLRQYMEEEEVPEIQAALIFTNPKTNVEVPEDADLPARTMTVSKLKDEIRKAAKDSNQKLTPNQIEKIQEIFDQQAGDEAD